MPRYPVIDFRHPSGAEFSDDRTHRYWLWRRWWMQCEPRQMAMFIGLNPSTADENVDDPTVRRCIDFAKQWGFGGMIMTNIFSIRSTDPQGIRQAGAARLENEQSLVRLAAKAGRVVCCWGTHGAYQGQGARIRELLADVPLYHLGLSKAGHPKHPLYLKATTQPERWT